MWWNTNGAATSRKKEASGCRRKRRTGKLCGIPGCWERTSRRKSPCRSFPPGEILPLFSDTELWEYPGQLVRKREMVIGGKVFHIASVFQGGEKPPSTPTGKLLSHIDRQLQKDPGGV